MSSQSSKPTSQASTTSSPRRGPRENLLDELQSLKSLLEDTSLNEAELDADLDIDIPILDDVVAEDATEKSVQTSTDRLLDLEAIFDEVFSPNAALIQHSEETQLNFDDLDIDVEIPAFKLALPDGKHLLPDELTLPPSSFTTPHKPLYTAMVTATNNFADAQAHGDVPADPEHSTPATVEIATTTTTTPMATEVDIHLLIQEIVDEFIPLVEDRLRQRLSGYPTDVIRQLAQKHLKS